MEDGIKSRIIIHEIIKLIKIKSYNFDEAFDYVLNNYNINAENKNFIYNVVLTTLRNSILIDKIINQLTKKIKKESDSYFLLLSSICQILILKTKEYAVVNCAVEISKAKKYKTSSGFINGCLRNLIRKKNILSEIKADISDLPAWFPKSKNKKLNKDFIETISLQPSIHIVFKKKLINDDYLNIGTLTSDHSLLIKDKYSFCRNSQL